MSSPIMNSDIGTIPLPHTEGRRDLGLPSIKVENAKCSRSGSQRCMYEVMLLQKKRLVLLLVAVCIRGGLCGFPGGDCIKPCISNMKTVLESTPLSGNKSQGQLFWQQFLQASPNRNLTEALIQRTCDAYKTMDKCLEECQMSLEFNELVQQSFAGFKFICVDHRKEFFNSLPCLAQYELKAMAQCRQEINESLVARNSFREADVKGEQHNIRSTFGTLCRDFGKVIKCIESVIRSGCGEDAAKMVLKLITVEFARFEQMEFSDQLPSSCRQLLSMSTGTAERRVALGAVVAPSPAVVLVLVALVADVIPL